MDELFDLIVLGGGPAGYLGAERAGGAGLKTLLIERAKVGGVCLNEGCIPSKTLLNSAKVYHYAGHGAAYGVFADHVRFDQAAVVTRKNKVVRTLVAGIRSQLKAAGVTVKEGDGMIVGRSGGVVEVKVGDEVFRGRRLLIATGSEAIVPPIPGIREGLDAGWVLTNREILDLQDVPGQLTVVGGGVIGLEMAGYYATVGSKVTVIEMLDHIAGNCDREVGALLQKQFSKQGITFHLQSQVSAVGNGRVTFRNADGEHHVQADKVLLSVGRRPISRRIGLESIGVYVERGRVIVDSQCRTNVPDVYAAGDINGVWMLAHAAYREAEVAVNTMLGRKDRMRYAAMPSVIYTQPEMAFVGETEETCRERGIDYGKTVLPMQYSGRYVAENDGGEGVIKILYDKRDGRLLGCHLLGSYASEIILAAGLLIENEMTLETIKPYIFPHPTVGEVIREAVFHSNSPRRG